MQDHDAAEGPPTASSVCLERLTARADFLRASRAGWKAMPGFVLQGRRRQPGETRADVIRVGFTCSKKVGNAVARNRAKRRLREIARLDLPRLGRPGWDYVLIGRRDSTDAMPFETLRRDLARAIEAVHR
ncbi:ribonuclease P protein component [Roseisalinus antarcticus]|uniref:Ribonuclease P protein component n=1 Tax=Roseisalinus antarcticus TaxID=254357 RepID=A0A1Y5TN92_9RHOB|nr:ribonuclease P protein component [Roseisalinus antarcticus]SLN67976.1 Ribonuclease P protein component [Roseisalinus antarcticus]